MTTLSGAYDYRLVALSVALAVFAAYAALDLAGRIASAHGRVRALWLTAGAVVMGLGIWAMHYVGMLAFLMAMPVFYHLPTVLLSLVASIAASVVALFVVSRPKMNAWQEALGSLIMGSGIAAMHYIGMAAMRCAAVIAYDRRIVGLSMVLAIAASAVALQLAFRTRDEKRTSGRKLISALVMGSAISLTHYTGMWAASFRHSDLPVDLTHAIGISVLGVAAVSTASLLSSGVAITSSFLDRFVTLQKGNLDAAREHELYFQAMAEAAPEFMWTAKPDGAVDYVNQRCCVYAGRGIEQLCGAAWIEIVHSEDVTPSVAKWESAMRTGDAYEVEYRLRGKDGTYKWFLCRGNPIRDAEGRIVKWFGTCTDIESQKHDQQILEAQIRERTKQLADTNTRLQEEMSAKDLARKQYDQQNRSMMGDLERRTERATMLAKMGELLQSCISREEVIAAALGFAPKIFPTARGAVVLLDAARSTAEVIGSWGDCLLPEMDFERSGCWALRTGHPHLVVSGDFTAPCSHAAGVAGTYLCIPILAQGETLGVLHFQATEQTPQMDPAELSFKTTFAGQVGLSIANIRLREALRTQSVRDALTGLYNRRYLEEVLEREIRRASRAEHSLGILMLDLDHFKTFNDTYGHDAGDAVLRETASALGRGIRAEDFVCRYGGEEFVVILPTANLENSRARAEKLRMKMKELTVMHQGRSMGMLTVSIGVAVFPEHGTSPKELMAAADAALYEAKRAGRDQVAVAATKELEEVALPATITMAGGWS